MQRLIRVITGIATIASALLCAAALVFWVRSYNRFPSIARADGRTSTHLTVQRGSYWATRID